MMSQVGRVKGWEQRWHPLRHEWVILAPHRQERPWNGEQSPVCRQAGPDYQPDCYLCPGNERVGGAYNSHYKHTFVFDNDGPCVAPVAPFDLAEPTGIYRNCPATGVARVVCFSPKHNTSLAAMQVTEIARVLEVWRREYVDLGGLPDIAHVLIFENKGEIVGVSNPHPHGQIYATNFVSTIIEKEVWACNQHFLATGNVLFQEILDAEFADQSRILCSNEHALSFVPYFGRYAYETYVVPKTTFPHLAALSDEALADFADVLQQTLVMMDNLWKMSFPYIMVLHQAPTDGGDYRSFHFHIEIHPPLRRPNLMKYLAGAEVGGGNFLSDTIPEEKASELRAVAGPHYETVPDSVEPLTSYRSMEQH